MAIPQLRRFTTPNGYAGVSNTPEAVNPNANIPKLGGGMTPQQRFAEQQRLMAGNPQLDAELNAAAQNKAQNLAMFGGGYPQLAGRSQEMQLAMDKANGMIRNGSGFDVKYGQKQLDTLLGNEAAQQQNAINQQGNMLDLQKSRESNQQSQQNNIADLLSRQSENDKTRAFEQQQLGDKFGMDLKLKQMELDQSKSLADERYNRDVELKRLGIEQAQNKPLPSPIVKEQQKIRDQIASAVQMNNMLSGFEKQLDEGKLNLSLTGNAANQALNYAGLATDESTNFSNFQAGMEKMRNDSLRLNSGVQTEGDAQRAWNELFKNINDEKVVKARLAEIRKYNDSAINFKKGDINAMRAEYGKGEFDDSAYGQQSQPATNQSQQTQIPPAPQGVDPAQWQAFMKQRGQQQ